jgi:TonB family protein
MKAFVVIVVLMGAPSVVLAQDPISAARDLYASAAYAEALAELARVEATAPAPATKRDADVYRTFCLVALGRDTEAQAVAESLVRRDPMLSLDQFPDASPRIATMYASVRRRVLPQVVKDEFRAARALAAGNAPEAQPRLQHVRQLLDAARQAGAWDETMADMRLIVDGFLDLAHTAERQNAAAEAAPVAAPPEPTSPPPAVVSSSPAALAASSKDGGVLAPIPVFQPGPAIPPALLLMVRQLHRSSTIDVLINEQGTVDDVTVKQSVTPAYDSLIVAAARRWRYKPALKDGVPVKFVSTVVVNSSRE